MQIDAVINAARKRLGELADERKKIDDELEFYTKDPSKAPDAVRRKIDDNTTQRVGAEPLHRRAGRREEAGQRALRRGARAPRAAVGRAGSAAGALSTPSSRSAQPGLQQRVDLRRVGLALAGLHDLADQRVEGLVLAGAVFVDVLLRSRPAPRRRSSPARRCRSSASGPWPRSGVDVAAPSPSTAHRTPGARALFDTVPSAMRPISSASCCGASTGAASIAMSCGVQAARDLAA